MAAQQQETETDEFEEFELLLKSNKSVLSFSVLNLSNQNFTNTPHGYLLAGFTNLKVLNLSANQIVRFSASNLLEGTPNLQELDLSKNKINSLEDILELGHSRTLSKLDFTENPVSNQFLRIKLIELLLFPSKYRKYDPIKIFTATYSLAFSNVTMKRRPDIFVNKTGNSFRESKSLIPLENINESSFVKFTKDPCPIPRRTHFPVLTNLNRETITVLDLQGILVTKDLGGILTDKNKEDLQKSVQFRFKKRHQKYIKDYIKRKTQKKEELYDVPSLQRLAHLLQDENDLRLLFLFDQIASEKRKKTPLDYEEIIWQGPADTKIKDLDFTIGISELNEMTKAHEELTEMKIKAKELSSGERIKNFRKAFLELREESAVDAFKREPVDPKKKANKKQKKKQQVDILEQQLKTPEKKNDISMTVTSNASVNEGLTVDEHGGNNLFHLTNDESTGENFDFEEEEEDYEGGESPFIFEGRQSKSNFQTIKEPESSQSHPIMNNFAERTAGFRVRSQSLTKFDKNLAKLKKVNWNDDETEKTPDSFMQMPILKLIKHAQSFAPEEIKMSSSITESSTKLQQHEDSRLAAAPIVNLRKTVFVARESSPNISVPLYVQKNKSNESLQQSKKRLLPRPTTAAVDKFSSNSQSSKDNNNYKTFTLNQTYGGNQSGTENLELMNNNIGHISDRKTDLSSVEDSKLRTINPGGNTNNNNQSSLETLMGKMNERTTSFAADEKETFKVQDMINDQKKKEDLAVARHQDEVRESSQSKATPMTRLQSAMGGERNSGQNFRSSYSNFFNTNEGFINRPTNLLPLSESNSNVASSLKKDPVSSRVPPTSSQSMMNSMKTHRHAGEALKSNEVRIVEKNYLRLLVSKIKAQKIRESEQKTHKKTKQDVLLRANSSQIAVRPNKNARSASNPAIRAGNQEKSVPNFKIYAYQNVSNPQEKQRKALINQICSKITQENFFKSKPQKATLKMIANPASARQSVEEPKIPANIEPKKISEYGGQFYTQFPDDADHSPPRRISQHYKTTGPKVYNQSGDQRWSTIRRAELFTLNNSIQQQSFSVTRKERSFSTVQL